MPFSEKNIYWLNLELNYKLWFLEFNFYVGFIGFN